MISRPELPREVSNQKVSPGQVRCRRKRRALAASGPPFRLTYSGKDRRGRRSWHSIVDGHFIVRHATVIGSRRKSGAEQIGIRVIAQSHSIQKRAPANLTGVLSTARISARAFYGASSDGQYFVVPFQSHSVGTAASH